MKGKAKDMEAIYKKDLKGLFNNMTGFVLCSFTLFMIGVYFTALCLMGGYAELGIMFNSLIFVFLIIVPLLTMRSLVEERRQKTDQLLLTSPASVAEIICGKFFALITVFALPLLVSCALPVVMSFFGNVSFARAYISIGAFFLLGAAAISIGLFISSLTESPVICGVCTFGALLMFYLMPAVSSLVSASALTSTVAITLLFAAAALILFVLIKNVVIPCITFVVCTATLWAVYFFNPSAMQGLFQEILNSLAIFERFTPFVNGTLDITSLVYYVSICVLFLFLTCQSIEKRRWS